MVKVQPEKLSHYPGPWTPFLLAGLAGIFATCLFWPTVQSIVQIWLVSETFTHGFFVVPVFLWLVWRKRTELLATRSQPDLRALLFVALAGAMWLLSKLAGVQVGEQFAFSLILVFTLWAILGSPIASQLKFPLIFLLFLAPVGEELVPILMEITADMTVWGIRNTGIPIYREGLFFSLPSGNWSVVEACSGIRYLIASSVLGALYAYLSYSSLKLRLSFFAVSLIMPVFANSVRAYIIVLLGHFSGNKLATGVDHLVYGWLFFGTVMFVLFSIGAWLTRFDTKEYDIDAKENSRPKLSDNTGSVVATKTTIFTVTKSMIVIILAVAIWPVWSAAIDKRVVSEIDAQVSEQFLPGGQVLNTEDELLSTPIAWQPRNSGHDLRLDTQFEDINVRAIAFVYYVQRQGKEMINSENVLVRSQRDHWRLSNLQSRKIRLQNGRVVDFNEFNLSSDNRRLTVWQWYRVGDSTTSSSLQTKLMEVRERLLLRRSPSVNHMIVMDGTSDDTDAALSKALARIIVTTQVD